MICPNCHGIAEDDPDDADPKRTTVNLGGKKTLKSFSIRRYSCTNCGYTFKTIEKHWESFERQKEENT